MKQLLCQALNKLIWKSNPPLFIQHADVNEFANYWLGELRDGPDDSRIEGIEWNEASQEFEESQPIS